MTFLVSWGKTVLQLASFLELLLLNTLGFGLSCFCCHLSLGIFWFLHFLQSFIGCLVTYCFASICLCFLQLYLIMEFSYCCWKQMLVSNSIFKNLPRLGLWSMIWSIVENVPCLFEMKVYSASLRWNVLQISNLMCHLRLGLLINFLPGWSAWVGIIWVLKFPTVVVLLPISPFIDISTCLIYWSVPLLCAYIFTIVMSSSWIDPLIIV